MAMVFARGLKVKRDEINALFPDSVPLIEGDHITDSEEQEIADFFRGKGIDWQFKIFIPSMRDYNFSAHIYICDVWEHILSQKRVNLESHKSSSVALEQLRRFLHLVSPIDSYVLHCPTVLMVTPEVTKRMKPPISCDTCDEIFTAEGIQAWRDRQDHRRRVHGSTEGDWPLPDNA